MDIAITTPIRTSMVSATIRRVCLKGITCKLFVTFDSLFVIVSTLELSIFLVIKFLVIWVFSNYL